MEATPLLIGVPTQDNRAIIHTVLELQRACGLIQRPAQFLVAQASNIPRSRNIIMEAARQQLYIEPDKPIWILWLDSDILLIPGQAENVAAMIQYAESHQVGITASYNMNDGRSVLMKTRDLEGQEHYTREDVAAMERGQTVGMAGMGFVYLPMPYDTVFHADTHGEDVLFFRDYPDLPLVVDPHVDLRHWKAQWF